MIQFSSAYIRYKIPLYPTVGLHLCLIPFGEFDMNNIPRIKDLLWLIDWPTQLTLVTWICHFHDKYQWETRSSWLNCALRDNDEAVYWVSLGHYEAVAVGNWWYWFSRGHLCLYILHKVEIWKGVTHPDGLTTLKDRAIQLLISIKVDLS